ncbi:unnamed protein product [Didymodactylos carnosus]|uniref:Protein kinase domain-containing protein n=1 Tax=Didymodactylos carnosus TaxID=1234261 RepID=A0A815RLN3_9BILA|nr:unnamed protein product [Didymodactylos carnosus]CAF1476733.1 unnamed protein product [Didymodactylos carnosus]CAF3520315.1 unnamed protein product [Didymodactylos carnosus]CAF4342749.1 unnamed protein product [Didymodactylos carnosus]
MAVRGKRLHIRGVPYKLESKIGYGLHSNVYSARDISTGRPVAIKIVEFGHGAAIKARTESRRQTFWKELDLLLHLQPLNPYIIRVLNWDSRETVGFIVMERGNTFRDTLVETHLSGEKLQLPLVKQFWSQMVEAIYFLHRIGIVHADVKPENFIQVGPDGTSLRLIDMGISFRLPPFITSRLKTAAGTPGDNSNKIAFLGKLRNDIRIPPHPDPLLRSVLRKCLRFNPRRRPTAEKLMKHPYLTSGLH